MFELHLVGKPPLVIPLEDDCSVKIVVPKPPNCQYNLCLKDLPPVTFLHINIGISQRDWIYGGTNQGHSASSQPGLGEYRNQMVSSKGGDVYNKPGGSLSYDYYKRGDGIFFVSKNIFCAQNPPKFSTLFFNSFFFSILSIHFYSLIWNFPLKISNHWTS